MKTKDFIKMLQEEDPSGECHIRMNGGFPYHVEQKQGYWDGAYSYIDDDGNFVTSIEDWKLDIFSMDINDFVEQKFDDGDPNNWEKIKNKLKFELYPYANPEQRKEKEEQVIAKARKMWEEMERIYKEIRKDSLEKALENVEKGWTWFQDKKVDQDKMYTYYHWKIFDENGKLQHSTVSRTKLLQKSNKVLIR